MSARWPADGPRAARPLSRPAAETHQHRLVRRPAPLERRTQATGVRGSSRADGRPPGGRPPGLCWSPIRSAPGRCRAASRAPGPTPESRRLRPECAGRPAVGVLQIAQAAVEHAGRAGGQGRAVVSAVEPVSRGSTPTSSTSSSARNAATMADRVGAAGRRRPRCAEPETRSRVLPRLSWLITAWKSRTMRDRDPVPPPA